MVKNMELNSFNGGASINEWHKSVKKLVQVIEETHKNNLTDDQFTFIKNIILNKQVTYYKINLIILLSEYLSLNSQYDVDVYQLVEDFILSNSQGYCVASHHDSEIIIKKFISVEKNVNVIIQTFKSFINEGDALNYSEWNEYLNNYSEYRNMPVSWILNFIKKGNINE